MMVNSRAGGLILLLSPLLLLGPVSSSEEAASGVDLFQRACQVFHASSEASPLEILSSDYISREAGWELLRGSAELEYPKARLTLAWAMILGLADGDLNSARDTLSSLANQYGDPDAQFGMGFLYATGLSVNSSQAKAMLYYSFAANGGSPLALMALGNQRKTPIMDALKTYQFSHKEYR
ncbi:Uncharacterized protein FKW44_004746, partial [Caligus rogercresseyi]